MDAPNAPNPANHNAQDQFIDAMQGPAAQVQGPAVQGPANNNSPVGQNVPIQPQQQLASAQPVPCWSGGAYPSGILSKLGRKET